MTLDVLIVMGGDQEHRPRAKATLEAYCSNREADPPFIVTTGDTSMYVPARRIAEAKQTHDYLVDNGVPAEDLISEHDEFLDLMLRLGVHPVDFPCSLSCDSYTDLLCALYESDHLGKDGKEKVDYGIVSDDDVLKSHLKLAGRMSSHNFTGIPSGYDGGLLRKALVGVQTQALIHDMNRFGVEKDNFYSHHTMLRNHPSLAGSFGSRPKGAYAKLSKAYVALVR